MKTFWFMLGVAALIAVCTVCVLLLNAELEKQKNPICYLGMATMDVLYVGYVGVCFLRLFGIV